MLDITKKVCRKKAEKGEPHVYSYPFKTSGI